jgi:hypothetical protein
MSGGVDLSPGTTCRLAPPVAWHLSLVSFSVRGVDPLPCGGVVGALPDVARQSPVSKWNVPYRMCGRENYAHGACA